MDDWRGGSAGRAPPAERERLHRGEHDKVDQPRQAEVDVADDHERPGAVDNVAQQALAERARAEQATAQAATAQAEARERGDAPAVTTDHAAPLREWLPGGGGPPDAQRPATPAARPNIPGPPAPPPRALAPGVGTGSWSTLASAPEPPAALPDVAAASSWLVPPAPDAPWGKR